MLYEVITRKAFKLGIEDYLLKPKLNKEYLYNFMSMIKEKLDKTKFEYTEMNKKNILKDYLENKEITNIIEDVYSIILIDITDIITVRKRFPSVHGDIIIPMKDLICQLPNAADSCEFAESVDANIIIRYHSINLTQQILERFCMQIKTIVKNYMNLDITIAASNVYSDFNSFDTAIMQAKFFLSMRYVYGENEIYTKSKNYIFEQEDYDTEIEKYQPLMNAFKQLQEEKMLIEQDKFLISCMNNDTSAMKVECLKMIYFRITSYNVCYTKLLRSACCNSYCLIL